MTRPKENTMHTVEEVMSSDVKTVTTSDLVAPVRDLMMNERVHGVPVVDEGGRVAGLVTAADMVEDWQPDMAVTALMSDEVLTVGPELSVVDAASWMLDHRIHHLVVVDDADRLTGIVSSFDLLRALAGRVEVLETKSMDKDVVRPGDHIVIRGHEVGRKERRGLIVETRGTDGGPPFVVNWLDDPHDAPHDVLFFPSSDADIEPADA